MDCNQFCNPDLSRPGRETKADLVSDFSILERPPKGRGKRNVTVINVHHFCQHNRIHISLICLEVQDGDARAQAHPISGCLGVGQLSQLVEPLMQLTQPGLHKLLALERRLVLRVLPQVTQRHRLSDSLRKEYVELMAELVDFSTQLVPHFIDHGWARKTRKQSPGKANLSGSVQGRFYRNDTTPRLGADRAASTARGAISCLGLARGLGLAAPAHAQAGTDSSSAAYHAIQWYEPLALMGGVTLTAALDEPVADHFRDHRSQTADDVADTWVNLGTVGVGVATAGVFVGGLISHNALVTHGALRSLFSAGVASVAAEGIKFLVGRERPSENSSAWNFDPGHTDAAFPSGHASVAFAMAASWSDEIHKTWATIGLYGVATGVAVGRVYQLEHWVSDVVGGAALGITSAKLVSGRWRIFGLRPPGFLATPTGAAIVWHASF
jgi:membrane-associated phospholipid phosphatase